MNSNLLRKTVCLLVLTAMILSTLLVLPQGFAAVDGTTKYDIVGVVVNTEDLGYVSGATVVLYNLHTGEMFNDTTKLGKFAFNGYPAGYYQLIVKPFNNYIQTNGSKTSFMITGEDDPDLEQILKLRKVPSKPLYTISGFVFDDQTSDFITEHEISLKSLDYKGYEVFAKIINDTTGEYEVSSFPGKYELWAIANEYAYYIEEIIIMMDINNYNITMSFLTNQTELSIRGYFKGLGGMTPWYFLFDLDNDAILYDQFSPPVLTIPAYIGNFSLVVDADGIIPYYHPEIIQLSQVNNIYKINNYENIQMAKTNDEMIKTNIKFRDNNWNKLEITETWTLNHDSELFGLELVDYGDPVTIGCPRFQIDYEPAFGIGDDGVLNKYYIDDGEAAKFKQWMVDKGPSHYYTNGYFEINGTHFGWNSNSISVTTSGFQTTDVDSTDAMKITTTANYNHLPTTEPINSSYLKIQFRNLKENEIIDFTLPAGYELDDPMVYDNKTVWIRASGRCQINYSDSTDRVTIYAIKHHEPTAIFDVSDNYTKALVDIQFNAANSLPGSGMISNYTWDFGDGTLAYGKTVEHNFTKSGIYNTTLTLTTSANLHDTTWDHITIDNTPPIVRIDVQNETGAILTKLLENTPTDNFIITFNGSRTKDTIDGVKPGEIQSYLWSFGDASGKHPANVVTTYSYTDPGVYEVTLNVTDRAGNYAIKTYEAKINDREPPVPNMFTTPPDKICHIDQWIIINGSNSRDNYDPLENLTFIWDLDATVDGNNDGNLTNDNDASGDLINYTPTKPGPVTITLMVTDKMGNFGHSVDMPLPDWTIDVVGVDLRFSRIEEDLDKFIDSSKNEPKVDDKVKFKVNITNEGLVTARDIQVKMFIDGKSKGTKTINYLERNDFKELTFKWTASGVKKHNITFNVNLLNDTWEQIWDNNEQQMDLKVIDKQIWDIWIMSIVIIIIVIVVIVLIYFYRRRREEAEFERLSKKGKSKGKGKGKGKKKDKSEKKEKTEKNEKKGKKK